ncbi:hypothetical protein O9H85_20815 [Paenibacillus filicis]|uniref:DUF3052 domain-containing protein n=1 Tax=Paenibacillus gyeongsangnamensis TaxID=3388067 RepID=A0ABT4QD74_9BACL|nr:hypothetical protein [Paenibacillus filicis]MCZ8514814.1 hypothetical protein [Paenibacillus filicis]
MNELLKKMNFKNQDRLLVLNAPEEFEPHLAAFAEFLEVIREPEHGERYPFVLTFTRNAEEVKQLTPLAGEHIAPEGLFWFAYPKGTSKKYKKPDISRDHGWEPVKELGFEGVRLIAIDDDWSCMRYREAK